MQGWIGMAWASNQSLLAHWLIKRSVEIHIKSAAVLALDLFGIQLCPLALFIAYSVP